MHARWHAVEKSNVHVGPLILVKQVAEDVVHHELDAKPGVNDTGLDSSTAVEELGGVVEGVANRWRSKEARHRVVVIPDEVRLNGEGLQADIVESLVQVTQDHVVHAGGSRKHRQPRSKGRSPQHPWFPAEELGLIGIQGDVVVVVDIVVGPWRSGRRIPGRFGRVLRDAAQGAKRKEPQILTSLGRPWRDGRAHEKMPARSDGGSLCPLAAQRA